MVTGAGPMEVAVGMRRVCLDAGDAAELAGLLEFVRDWLGGDAFLAGSLGRFAGSAGYGVEELRADLIRFAFLLGGDVGEVSFGPGGHR
jgi:hypothetical protein